MTKSLYYEVKFTTLHQKKPSDYGSSPTLSIGSIQTSRSKYGLEFGYGDPGENPNSDTFDYSEFTAVGAGFAKPTDYGARLSFVKEGPNGGTMTVGYSKYGIVQVPDNFFIPPDIPTLPAGGTPTTPVTPTDPTAPANPISDPNFKIGTIDIKSDGTFSFKFTAGGTVSGTGPIELAKAKILELSQNTVESKLKDVFGTSLFDSVKKVANVASFLNDTVSGGTDVISSGMDVVSGRGDKAKWLAATDAFWKGRHDAAKENLAAAIKISLPESYKAEFVLQLNTKFGSFPIYKLKAELDPAEAAASFIMDELVLRATVDSAPNVKSGEFSVGFYDSSYWKSDIINTNSTAIISPNDGDDLVSTGDNNNTAILNFGNDTWSAGEGFDTSVYSGKLSEYSISRANNFIEITDKRGTQGGDGVDQLYDVEQLQFKDGVIRFGIGQHDLVAESYRVYQAAFARTPDTGGLSYWARSAQNGLSLKEIATAFVSSQEFKTVYGANPSNASLVSKFYENVLGRAPDSGGLAYWIGLLERGISLPEVLVGFSESSENILLTTPKIGAGVTLDTTFFV